MIVELAHFCMLLAIMFAGVVTWQAFNGAGIGVLRQVSWCVWGALSLSIVGLMVAFVTLDYSVAYVQQNAHDSLPIIYRITALWGAHEGSLLLLIWWLATWQVTLSHQVIEDVKAHRNSLAIMAFLLVVFGCFIAFTSNPFLRLWPMPASMGADLNPLLQDPGFVLHPPILYGGYTGCLVLTSLVLGWAWGHDRPLSLQPIRRLLLVAMALLTMGITLGSWWAYHVLGWGGVWFWDPVENVSLMPWLLLMMSLHHLRLKYLNAWGVVALMVMAMVMVSLIILGVFLVRSGVLVSVHTFAADATRGLYLLSMLLVIWLGCALVMMRFKSSFIEDYGQSSKWLLVPLILFGTALAVVVLGTLAPIVAQMGGQSITVGAPYFQQMMMPIAGIAVLALGLHTLPQHSFKIGSAKVLGCQALVSLLLSAMLAWWYAMGYLVFSLIATPVIWSMLRLGWSWQRGSYWAHQGFLLLLLSITIHWLGTTGYTRHLSLGQSVDVNGMTIRYVNDQTLSDDQRKHKEVQFNVYDQQHFIGQMTSGITFYSVRQMAVPNIGTLRYGLTDVYVALSQEKEPHQWVFRVAFHPWVYMIWVSGLMMVIGGVVSWNSLRKS